MSDFTPADNKPPLPRPSSRWLISVPVWGPRCVELFCANGLPALLRSVARLLEGHDVDVRLVVHTDRPGRVTAASGGAGLMTVLPVPAGLREFDCMSQAHREVMAMGCRGDVVVPLTADTVLSEGGLVYAAGVLANPQKLLVCCAVPRALQEGQLPEETTGAALGAWAWENRHPITQDSTWPEGRAADLSRVYFEDEGSVVTRLCLPHPLALRVDGRALPFVPTVDVNLTHCFQLEEIHLAPSFDELALIELSPRSKGHALSPLTMEERLDRREIRIPGPHQRWFLSQRVRMTGPPRECGDSAYVDRVLAASGGAP